jgi:hypothetical protein
MIVHTKESPITVAESTTNEATVATSVPTNERGEIVVLNRDLFFGVKIGNILRSLGYLVAFVPATEPFVARLREGGRGIVLGIIDMGTDVEWSAIANLTGADGPGTPILAFGSHLDIDGRRAAKAAGVTRVLSNGDFHRDMVALVERYARTMREEEES